MGIACIYMLSSIQSQPRLANVRLPDHTSKRRLLGMLKRLHPKPVVLSAFTIPLLCMCYSRLLTESTAG